MIESQETCLLLIAPCGVKGYPMDDGKVHGLF
jgi:hypothetical protein